MSFGSGVGASDPAIAAAVVDSGGGDWPPLHKYLISLLYYLISLLYYLISLLYYLI